jgi:Icc-related predicted phosphoesterase
MRIQIASDLHLEFSPGWQLPSAAGDVLVLAGDIGARATGLRAFAAEAKRRTVIYVPGNHEYYGGDMATVAGELRESARELGMHLLDNEELLVGGVRFLGSTLWTDFDLFGEASRIEAMRQASRHVVDYHVVSIGTEGWLTPERTRRLHLDARAWLAAKLAQRFAGPTVVVSHHAPHLGSLHPRFARSPISPAFVSNLEALMGSACLWIHGHTHDSFDYVAAGTRVICNPRGYVPFEPNPRFAAELVVEI